MRKIIIIGCSGSGKSTLAKKLGNKLKIDVYHLDKIWWKGNWENITKNEFKGKVFEIAKKDSWIIDGNYIKTLDFRLKYCDMVIYLDYNVFFCLFNIIIRYFLNRGKVREDMGGNCVEKLDWEFIGFVLSFNRKNRSIIYNCINNSGKKILVFRSRRKLNKWLMGV